MFCQPVYLMLLEQQSQARARDCDALTRKLIKHVCLKPCPHCRRQTSQTAVTSVSCLLVKVNITQCHLGRPSTGTLKMRERKMRHWKMQHLKCKGGKCRTGKCEYGTPQFRKVSHVYVSHVAYILSAGSQMNTGLF